MTRYDIDGYLPHVIAFAGDWHANINHARAAVEWCAERKVDTIIHVGDFGFRFEDRFRFLDELNDQLSYHDITLFFVPGNHDNYDYLDAQVAGHFGPAALRSRIIYLPKPTRWTWDDIRFLGLGGATSLDVKMRTPGWSWWSQEAISMLEFDLAAQGGAADIMIAHDCPSGVEIPGGHHDNPRGFPEDAIRSAEGHRSLLRELTDIVRPVVYYHGHYHYRYTHHERGMTVFGLDRDKAPMSKNMMISSMEHLKQVVDRERKRIQA